MRRAIGVVTMLIFCVAVILVASSGGAIGAENSSDNETDSYLGAIDSDLRLVDGEMADSDVMRLELEADQETEIAITDSSQEIDGFIDINREIMTVPEGRTTVEFRVANPSHPAVTIDSQEGLSAFGSQDFSDDRPAINWGTVQALLAGTAIGTTAIIFRVVKKKREDDQPKSKQIL